MFVLETVTPCRLVGIILPKILRNILPPPSGLKIHGGVFHTSSHGVASQENNIDSFAVVTT
jgi:hypothetical protein